jgi:hypothetical protein
MSRKNQAYTEYIYVWDIATNLPKTGDAANITIYTAKDGGSSAVSTNSVAEVDATNMPGVYSLALTAAEMNGDSIAVAGVSSTAQVHVNSAFISTEDIKADTLQLITDVASVQTDTTQIISDVGSVQTGIGNITDNVANKTIIAEALKEIDVNAITAVSGSIYSDIKTDTAAVVAKLPAGIISDMSLNDVVDGAKVRTIFGLMKARVLNKYNINNPASGDITFFQNDDVTFFARVTVTSSGRTKTSFVDL